MTCEPNNPLTFPSHAGLDVEIGLTTSGYIHLTIVDGDERTSISMNRAMAIRLRENLDRAIGNS